MGPVVAIGILCVGWAGYLFLTDPLDFHPDPFGQGMVWLIVGAACFLTAWYRRKWRPPNGQPH